jgi:hypothetical protein
VTNFETPTSAAATTTAAARPLSQRAWTIWLFRATTLIASILMFDQSVYAGQFLSGVYGSLISHRDMSTYAVVSIALCVVASVLVRWPGRGPWWPVPATLVLLGTTALLTNLGYRAVLGLHIPLGVLAIVLTIGLTVWAWWRKK